MKNLKEYGIAIFAISVATGISFAIFTHFAAINLVMIYLLATVAVAARGHRGPAILASALGVLFFDFFFVPPRFSFSIHDAEYLFTFFVMFVAAMTISHLTIRLRAEATVAHEAESRATLMHAFAQTLSRARGLDRVLEAAAQVIEKTFDATMNVYLPTGANRVQAPGADAKETAIAQWVHEKGEPAGRGEKALPFEDNLFLPLRGSANAFGVIGLRPKTMGPLSAPQRQLLDSFVHQIVVALETETERLRSSLLSSVSHDFRTPVTAIVGSAGTLLAREDIRDNPKVAELVENILDEGERLARQIQNLLDATRLESGAVNVRKELYPLEDVIGITLDRLKKTLAGRQVDVRIDETFPPVPMDGLLIEQVFVNLLENAARHTPAETPITISAVREGGQAIVSVADKGPGLAEGEQERVFEKFYHQKSSPGAGLGLSICRAAILAHGGRIWANNQPDGGAVFSFSLPLENFHGK